MDFQLFQYISSLLLRLTIRFSLSAVSEHKQRIKRQQLLKPTIDRYPEKFLIYERAEGEFIDQII